MRPRTSYFICSNTRSGTSLLSEVLAHTGVAGHPEEYFGKDFEAGWFERLGASTYGDFVARVIERGSTPNGVFGAEMPTGHGWFAHFVNRLRGLPEYRNRTLSVPKLMSDIFSDPRYVWTTRRNKVRQAVSFWKAIQTGIWSWRSDEPPVLEKEPEFSFEAIDHLVQAIVMREASWQEYFDDGGIVPFVVVYEDFVRGREKTALEILGYLDIPVPDGLAGC